MSTRSTRIRKSRSVQNITPQTPPRPRPSRSKLSGPKSTANGAELVGRLVQVEWPSDEDNDPSTFYNALVLGYNARRKQHKVIYLEEESIELCELGHGPKYRNWRDPPSAPSDPLVGARLRFVDNETGSDQSWFDFMRANPNRTTPQFHVYVYSHVMNPNPEEVSGPRNLSNPSHQYYRIVHAPNDYLTTVDLSCVDYITEETLKLPPQLGGEAEPHPDSVHASAGATTAETHVVEEGVVEETKQPSADATRVAVKEERDPNQEQDSGTVAEGETGVTAVEVDEEEDIVKAAEKKHAETIAKSKQTTAEKDEKTEDDGSKLNANGNGTGPHKENTEKDADTNENDVVPSSAENDDSTGGSRSRVRTTPTKSVDVIPDDENLPENLYASGNSGQVQADAVNIDDTHKKGVDIDVDPDGNNENNNNNLDTNGTRRQRPSSIDENTDKEVTPEQPARKLRRTQEPLKTDSTMNTVGNSSTVEKDNGEEEDNVRGTRPLRVDPIEGSPATQDTRDEPLLAVGSGRLVSGDTNGNGIIIKGETEGDDEDIGEGDSGPVKMEDEGQEGYCVGDYISVNTGSGIHRQAYVEAYFESTGLHFLAFCDARGGHMQVKLTPENHTILDDKQATALTKMQSRSKVDALPVSVDMDDQGPNQTLSIDDDEVQPDVAGDEEDEDVDNDDKNDRDVEMDDMIDEDDEHETPSSSSKAPSSRRTRPTRTRSTGRQSKGTRTQPSRQPRTPLSSGLRSNDDDDDDDGSNGRKMKKTRGRKSSSNSLSSPKVRRVSTQKILGHSAKEELLSRCISVLWPNTSLVYVALVMGYSPETKQHMLLYMVDHCVEILELRYREWQLLPRGKEPFNSSGMVGKRIYVWWPGEYTGSAQRLAGSLFGERTKVAYEAYVISYIGKSVYKIVYPCNEDCEERMLVAERSDAEDPLDKEWDILPPGENEVCGLPVIGWEG